jgi:hypothetical protein
MADLTGTARRLSDLSVREQRSAYVGIDWPDRVDRRQWFTSPELVSVYGTAVWDALPEGSRKELSFWEAVSFCSLNIHGERALMQGLAARLYIGQLREVTEYLHHFLGEENKHSVWFGRFCMQYAGRVYPERRIAFPREYAEGEEDFLFFAKVAIFEEIVDRYNAAMATDDRLVAIARTINANHHADETRHLAFGRTLVAHLWTEYASGWTPATVDGVRSHLSGYLTATWRDFYSAEAYRDAGIADPVAVARAAWADDVTRRHRVAMTSRCGRFLAEAGILTDWEQAL